MNMSKRNIAVLIIVAVVVIVIIVLGARFGGPGGVTAPSEDAFRPENPDALQTVEGGTREVVKEKIATPELGSTSTPEGVAVPTNFSQISGPGGEAGLRDFELKAEGGEFMPNTIVVNDGDIITIHLTAVDGDYNIFFPDFGVYQEVSQGQTVKRQFQATPFGQYEFYCKECNNEAKGTLIINER
jgi:rubredoxin